MASARIKCRRGFTLIELLVVVAIIAVLIALLLPTLNKARERAKTVACLANIKGCGVAFLTYAGEWEDNIFITRTVKTGYSYPGDISGDWPGNTKTWPYLYIEGKDPYGHPGGCPKYITSPKVALCPAESTYAVNSRRTRDFTGYGAYSPDYYEIGPRGFNFVPRTWNTGGWWDMAVYMNYPGGTVISATVHKPRLVASPSTTIMLADTLGAYGDQQCLFKARDLSFNWAAIHLIHGGKANVTFYDGHGETLLPQEMRYNTATAPDHFFAANPGPGSWNWYTDPTNMFPVMWPAVGTGTYKNIKFPPL